MLDFEGDCFDSIAAGLPKFNMQSTSPHGKLYKITLQFG